MSEPVHIKEILPAVMSDIERRMERADSQRQSRVIEATKGFLAGRKRGRGTNRVPKILEKQRKISNGG